MVLFWPKVPLSQYHVRMMKWIWTTEQTVMQQIRGGKRRWITPAKISTTMSTRPRKEKTTFTDTKDFTRNMGRLITIAIPISKQDRIAPAKGCGKQRPSRTLFISQPQDSTTLEPLVHAVHTTAESQRFSEPEFRHYNIHALFGPSPILNVFFN